MASYKFDWFVTTIRQAKETTVIAVMGVWSSANHEDVTTTSSCALTASTGDDRRSCWHNHDDNNYDAGESWTRDYINWPPDTVEIFFVCSLGVDELTNSAGFETQEPYIFLHLESVETNLAFSNSIR